MGMKRGEIREIIERRDLSESDEFKVEGPWAFNALEGLRTPIFIYLPGGERQEVGFAIAKIEGGPCFEIYFDPKYDDVDRGQFEFPMRFTAIRKDTPSGE